MSPDDRASRPCLATVPPALYGRYKKPPMVSEEMMGKLRSRLGFLMLLHTIVAWVGSRAASAESGNSLVGTGPVSIMFGIWFVYELIDLPDCLSFIPGLREFDELTAGEKGGEGALDTLGIPYKTDGDKLGVQDKLGYPIEEYICPSVTKYPGDCNLPPFPRHLPRPPIPPPMPPPTPPSMPISEPRRPSLSRAAHLGPQSTCCSRMPSATSSTTTRAPPPPSCQLRTRSTRPPSRCPPHR